MGSLWYKPRRNPRPRVYWCPGQYGGVGLLVLEQCKPNLSAGGRLKKLATSSFEPLTFWGTTERCESESLKSPPAFTS